MKPEKQCKRCGTCCKKGGPILHTDDLPLIRKGILPLQRLITIRKGEPAFNPFTEQVGPAILEMIKITGKGASWECAFYDALHSACTIHADRPLECRQMECWETEKIAALYGKNCLNRFDLIEGADPIREFISVHERKCSYTRVQPFLDRLVSSSLSDSDLQQLTTIMEEDLSIRGQAVAAFSLSLHQELFYFGRPLFQTLQHPSLRVTMYGSSIQLELIQRN